MKAVAKVILAIIVAWMALAACLLVAFPARAIEVIGNALILDADDLRQCRDEGGCTLITALRLKQLKEAVCERKKDET